MSDKLWDAVWIICALAAIVIVAWGMGQAYKRDVLDRRENNHHDTRHRPVIKE